MTLKAGPVPPLTSKCSSVLIQVRSRVQSLQNCCPRSSARWRHFSFVRSLYPLCSEKGKREHVALGVCRSKHHNIAKFVPCDILKKKIHPLTTVNIMDSNRREDAKTGCRSCFGSHWSSGHSHCWGEVWAWASCLSPQLSLSCRQSFSTGHKASG